MGAGVCLSPEDAGGVRVDLDEQLVDVRCRLDEVVVVEPEVAVAVVEGPLVAGLGVTEAAYRQAGPVGADIVVPRGSAFHNGDRSCANIYLVADQVPSPAGEGGVASLDPLPDPGKSNVGYHSIIVGNQQERARGVAPSNNPGMASPPVRVGGTAGNVTSRTMPSSLVDCLAGSLVAWWLMRG